MAKHVAETTVFEVRRESFWVRVILQLRFAAISLSVRRSFSQQFIDNSQKRSPF